MKTPEQSLPAKFIDKKYPELRKSKQVELCEKISEDKKSNKIDVWLKSIEGFHKRQRDNPESMEHIRKAFYDEYVIRPENIPESYFENQQKLARELGHGDVEITDETRKHGAEIIINDQKSTLDKWINYLFSKDTDNYPIFAKYWALRSMTKLSSYDKEKKAFGNRREDTVTNFPDLNREALAQVMNIIVQKTKEDAKKEKLSKKEKKIKREKDKKNKVKKTEETELQKLIQSENFGKLYAYEIEKAAPEKEKDLSIIEGEWIKYDKDSDHMPLVESLQGHGTGWCTAGESTAELQLKGGDFYVYYSNDENNNPTIPRVAIRMEENRIGEVRGIAPDQNLDNEIQDVLDEKLSEFPDKEKYEKKTADMKFLTSIEKKVNKEEELNIEELKFLYEIETKIEGFGYEKDPRIEEIIEGRNIKEDLSLVTGFSKEQISVTKEEAMEDGIEFHYGDINLINLQSAEGIKFPKTINGSLYLGSLQSAEGLKFPETVGGYLSLNNLQSAEGLKLPETIGKDLNLHNLQSAEGLKLPETIGKDLNLHNLQSAEGLKLPETINGSLYLFSLQSAEGLKLSETIGGNLNLHNLQSAKGLKFPRIIGGNLNLNSLQSAEGLKLSEIIGCGLNLESLQSAEGLKLSGIIDGNLNLSNLQSTEGLKLSETINGELFLNSLQFAEKEELRKKYPELNIV